MDQTQSQLLPSAPVGPPGVDTQLMRAAIAADLFDVAAMPIRIGRFEVLRRLGSGAMGDVFAAADPQLDRTVAVNSFAPTRHAVMITPRSSCGKRGRWRSSCIRTS